jgi:hypothetical protein
MAAASKTRHPSRMSSSMIWTLGFSVRRDNGTRSSNSSSSVRVIAICWRSEPQPMGPELARTPLISSAGDSRAAMPEASREVLCVMTLRLSRDGDATVRRVTCTGCARYTLRSQPADPRPIARLCHTVDPKSHGAWRSRTGVDHSQSAKYFVARGELRMSPAARMLPVTTRASRPIAREAAGAVV